MVNFGMGIALIHHSCKKKKKLTVTSDYISLLQSKKIYKWSDSYHNQAGKSKNAKG